MVVYSAGVGFTTVQALVRRGARVYLGARSEDKANDAMDRLKKAGLGSGEVHYLQVDLSDVAKAKAAAEEFMRKESRLDILSASSIAVRGPELILIKPLSPSLLQSTTRHSEPLQSL